MEIRAITTSTRTTPAMTTQPDQFNPRCGGVGGGTGMLEARLDPFSKQMRRELPA